MQRQGQRKIICFLAGSFYVLVNGLFLYKYGQRQEWISPYLLLAFYAVLSGFVFWSFVKGTFGKWIPDAGNSKYFYGILVLISSLAFFFLVYKVNGETLKVDRWSALQLTVEGIIKGQYPYSRPDHLQNMSSNLPALGWLAIPFYLMGDVGYLQVFVFLFFAVYLFKAYGDTPLPYLLLFLYLFSPAFWWELIVKSDLVSNMILFALFLDIWERKYRGDNSFHRPVLLGAFLAFFLLTRGVLIIPVIIFFFKEFLSAGMAEKIRFIVSFLLVALLISLPILLSVPDWDTLVRYNPFVLQTNKAPLFAYLFLLAAFAVPYRFAREHYYFYAALLVFAIPFSSMLALVVDEGWRRTLFANLFDISYLSMSLPFLLFAIAQYCPLRNGMEKAARDRTATH